MTCESSRYQLALELGPERVRDGRVLVQLFAEAGSTDGFPRRPAPSGRIRDASSVWTARVRKSFSGSASAPGGIHLRSISAVSGS